MFTNRFDFIKISGIRIGIDVSWLFIAILLSWTLAVGHFPFYYHDLSASTYWLMGICGMLGLFICIILHELGHAMVAKHYQLPTSQITLFIFGGVAEIKKEPPNPKVEFLVAIAGPIVSVLLSLCLYIVTLVGILYNWPMPVYGVTSYLASINLALAIFNMIPAFPLDGGRVLRAILWWWKNNLSWATKISTACGMSFGLVLVLFGIFFLISGDLISGLWLAIIGLFLRAAAASTRTQFYVVHGLRGEKVSKYMTKDPITVPPDITVSEFIENYVYQSYHHLYPVTENGKLLGYISLKEVKSLTPEIWGKTLVRSVMVPVHAFQTVTPETSALEALTLMHQIDSPTLLVVNDGHLVGILTSQNLLKLISLKLELE